MSLERLNLDVVSFVKEENMEQRAVGSRHKRHSSVLLTFSMLSPLSTLSIAAEPVPTCKEFKKILVTRAGLARYAREAIVDDWRAILCRSSLLVFVFCVPITFSASTAAASFDCKKPLTPVERAICEDEELSKLDDQLDRVYKSALSKVRNREELRESQREWLKSERKKSAVAVAYGGEVNVYGLKHLYRMRIIELGASVITLSEVLGSYTKLTPLTQVDPDKPGGSAFIQIGVHEDYVNLVQDADGKVEVSLWLTYANSHLCRLEGVGAWKANHVLVEQTDKWSTCNLKIISDGNSALLKDLDNCTRMFCGARGALNNTIVPRKKH